MKKLLLMLSLLLSIIMVRAQKKSVESPKANKGKDTCCCCILPDTVACADSNSTIVHAKTIILDFKTKNLAFPKKSAGLKRGDAVKIKVINYNPYFYNVIVNDKDSTVYAMNDGKYLPYFMDPANLTNLVANISSLPISVNAFEKADAIPISFETQKYYKNSAKKKESKAKISPKYKEYQSRVIELYHHIIIVKDLIMDSLYAYSRTNAFLNKQSPDCRGFNNIPVIVNNIDKSFKNFRREVTDLKSVIERDSLTYNDWVNTIPDSIKESAINNYAIVLTKNFYVLSNKMLMKLDSTVNYKEQKKLIDYIEPIQLLSNCYTSLPIFYTSDVKRFSIELKPWKDTLHLASFKTEFELPWAQKHVWGVSAGTYFANLHNNAYSNIMTTKLNTATATKDTTYNLKMDNTGSYEFGVNALAYTGWRLGDGLWYCGAVFGAGSSIESKPKPRVMLGGSFIYGDKNRVLLSIGLISGYVQRLSSIYQENQLLNKLPVTYMKDEINTRFFFSINYSFLGK